MTKVISIIAILLIFMGCDKLFGSGPANVVKRFYELAEKGEVSKAFELFSEGAKGMLNMMGGTKALIGLTDEIKKKGGIKNFKVVKEDITGELATIRFEITFGNGSVKKDDEKLIKQDGKWKIDAKK